MPLLSPTGAWHTTITRRWIPETLGGKQRLQPAGKSTVTAWPGISKPADNVAVPPRLSAG